jgi:Ca2+-binding EF-hand superfamily protein
VYSLCNRCGDIIFDAFKFIDTDNSGRLSKDEISDGFAAFGVLIDDSVTDKVLEVRHSLYTGMFILDGFQNRFKKLVKMISGSCQLHTFQSCQQCSFVADSNRGE